MTKELREKDWKPKLQSLINNYPDWVIYGEIEQYVSNMIIEVERRMKEMCLECIPDKKDMPDHECPSFECEHYPRTDTHNILVDKITTAISSLK